LNGVCGCGSNPPPEWCDKQKKNWVDKGKRDRILGSCWWDEKDGSLVPKWEQRSVVSTLLSRPLCWLTVADDSAQDAQ